jgi:hypothetical protein
MHLWKIVAKEQRTVAAVGHVFARFESYSANYFARSFSSMSKAGMTARDKFQPIEHAFNSTRQLHRFFSLSNSPNSVPNFKKDWNELSEVEKRHWVCLGWSSSSWLQGPPPESERRAWANLSNEEKAAARALKLSKLIPRDSSLHDPFWAKDSFDGAKHFDGSKKLWNELRECDQSNWKVLGWEMSSWNEGRISLHVYTINPLNNACGVVARGGPLAQLRVHRLPTEFKFLACPIECRTEPAIRFQAVGRVDHRGAGRCQCPRLLRGHLGRRCTQPP